MVACCFCAATLVAYKCKNEALQRPFATKGMILSTTQAKEVNFFSFSFFPAPEQGNANGRSEFQKEKEIGAITEPGAQHL